MAKLTSKWITDGAVLAQHLAADAKQGVLESKLKASRRGVLNKSVIGSSLDVSTEVLAVATTDTPQSALTAKGIYVGAVASAADPKKVLIRATGTDNGIADGENDEIYGVLTEAAGVYTLSFKQADGGAYSFGGATPIDFYFVEIFDLFGLPADDSLYGAVGGVVDAGQAATLAGHLDGGNNKHDASEIDVEGTGSYYAPGSAETAFDTIDAQVLVHDGEIDSLVALSGRPVSSADLGTFAGTTIPDASTVQAALQSLETAVELRATSVTVAEIDQNVDDLVALSGLAENSTTLGTFTGATIPDTSTIKAALQALETEVELKAATTTVSEIDANVDDLITLSGVAENVGHLGTFTGATIADSSTVKAALQSLETAVEGVTSEIEHVEYFTLGGGDITNKYVDLANVPKAASNVRMFIKSAPNQFYGDDFTVITDGSVVRRVSWNGLALDTVLAAGDKLTLVYSV